MSDGPFDNGNRRRLLRAGAVSGAIITISLLFGSYIWPWVNTMVHQLDTIMWVNELRAESPYLSRDAKAFNEYLNGAAERARRLSDVERSAVEFRVTADEINRKLARQDGELAVQRHMLELLLRDRGITPPRRRPEMTDN